MKQLCPIHRYNYSGRECPYCAKDRKERIESLYADEIAEYANSQKITEDDILRLSEKYNVQTKKK